MVILDLESPFFFFVRILLGVLIKKSYFFDLKNLVFIKLNVNT